MEENTRPDVSPERSAAGSVQNFTFRDLGQALALTVSAAYFCGFIVVTAHLGRFGLREYDPFRTQYLVAGAIVFVLVGVFAYFVWNLLTRLDTNTAEYEKLFERLGGAGRGWAIWAFVYASIEVAYFVVVCTIVAASLLFPLPQKSVLFLVLAIVAGKFLIDMILTSAASEHLSPWSFVWIGIFMGAAVVGFLLLTEGPYYDFSFLFFVSVAVVIGYQRQKRLAPDPKAVTAYFVVFSLIAFSAAFGASFYGRVRTSVGGGAPVTVRLVMSEQSLPAELSRALGITASVSAPVDLLAETTTEFVLGRGAIANRYEQIVRVKRDIVTALVLPDPRSQQAPN